jgi:hypothetical protein
MPFAIKPTSLRNPPQAYQRDTPLSIKNGSQMVCDVLVTHLSLLFPVALQLMADLLEGARLTPQVLLR